MNRLVGKVIENIENMQVVYEFNCFPKSVVRFKNGILFRLEGRSSWHRKIFRIAFVLFLVLSSYIICGRFRT